jgi:GT2 family glycosyltransferase
MKRTERPGQLKRAEAGAVPDLVSILIPAYNCERWLAQTLRSALAQTWPHKEIVVVDDGSADNSLQVARRFEGAGVRVVTQPNAGAAAARNAALALAKGDYIQWLDADDILHPEKIERQMVGAAGGGMSRTMMTCSWGRFFDRIEGARFAPDPLWQTLSPVNWMTRKFSHNVFMFPAAWLVSRRLIELAGPWDNRLSLDDDGEYICRLVAASDTVHFVPSARCYYRIGNAGSLSGQKSEKALQSAFLSMQLSVDHLLKLESSTATRRACLALVQDNYAPFFPEHAELVARCHALAATLGGNLEAPRERTHFRLFRQLLGWRAAKATRSRMAQWRWRMNRLAEHWRVASVSQSLGAE